MQRVVRSLLPLFFLLGSSRAALADDDTPPAVEAPPAPRSEPIADAPARANESPGWKNPFASGAQPAPRLQSAGFHAGSVLGRGYGVDAGITAFPWLEAKLGYGYGAQHVGVAYVKATLIPTAYLSPYLVGGYSYGVTSVRAISLKTHEAIAGLGLQARFADRFFVGGEVTANIVLLHQLSDRRVSTAVEISDPYTINVGFVAGAWFL